MSTPDRRNPFRQAFLLSMVCATLLVIVAAVWCLLPAWSEYLDQQRVGALCAKLDQMSLDEYHGSAAYPLSASVSRLREMQIDEVERDVNQISSITALSTLASRCLVNVRGGIQESLNASDRTLFDLSSWALVCVFCRLSAINTDQSARALVDLYCSEELKFDGEYAECASAALFECRHRAIPYLKSYAGSLVGPQRDRLESRVTWLESDGKRW